MYVVIRTSAIVLPTPPQGSWAIATKMLKKDQTQLPHRFFCCTHSVQLKSVIHTISHARRYNTRSDGDNRDA
eukprot:5523168-Amphidinium_carterae.1